jgi:DNA-binding transcriptional MerR regulator
MNENNSFDNDFNDDNEEHINGRPLYLSTSQVGQIIGETDSTIRFWCSKFKDILDVQMVGSHRKFSEENIEKLKYVKKLLRDEGYSINQVIEYASKDVKKAETQVQKKEPLGMQALATALSIQIASDLEEYKMQIRNELIQEIRSEFRDINESIKEQKQLQEIQQTELKEHIAVTMSKTLDSSLDEKLDIKLQQTTKNITQSISEQFQTHMDEREAEYQKKMNEQLERLSKNMELQKQQYLLEQEEKNKKGFFGKIFGSKK